MKYAFCLVLFVALLSCHSAKKSSESTSVLNSKAEEGSDMQFDCYHDSDTLENLVLYFPEEKKFFINSEVGNKEDLCYLIQNDINQNKGVKHYYHPQSNFMFMISIVRAVEKCYKEKIEELSIEEYGLPYEKLNSDQKAEIDSRLNYRIIGE